MRAAAGIPMFRRTTSTSISVEWEEEMKTWTDKSWVFLTPIPPIPTGKEAYVQAPSCRSTFRIASSPSLTFSSKQTNSSWQRNVGEVRWIYCSLGTEKHFFSNTKASWGSKNPNRLINWSSSSVFFRRATDLPSTEWGAPKRQQSSLGAIRTPGRTNCTKSVVTVASCSVWSSKPGFIAIDSQAELTECSDHVFQIIQYFVSMFCNTGVIQIPDIELRPHVLCYQIIQKSKEGRADWITLLNTFWRFYDMVSKEDLWILRTYLP